MMSLRRWLTSRYDVTGLSRLFYRSWKAELLALVLVGTATLAGFLAYGVSHGDIRVYHGPNAFLSSPSVHAFDWTMAAVLASLLAVNALRMWWLTTGGNERFKVPLWSYLKHLYLLPLHFFTQKRYALCEDKRPWLTHLILVFSYVTMLVLIMFFLHRMQSGPGIQWSVHALGYLASIGLLTTVAIAIYRRGKKTHTQFEHSHESDWFFLVMLLVVSVTGVAQHVLHRSGADLAANLAYLAHLTFVVPMLVIEVPFSKWSHLVYRPLAMYLAQVQSDAVAGEKALAAASGAADVAA
jgi:hypothetical protein